MRSLELSGEEVSRRREVPGPGQRSVWDFPRPPIVEPERRRVRIELGGVGIVDTAAALRVLETSHPPTIYVPFDALMGCEATHLDHTSVCEYKGTASYWTLTAGGVVASRCAWGYDHPRPGYEILSGHLAVYPSRVDGAWLDQEQVRSQDSDFYGGWLSDDVVGPFKGPPGTWGW